MITFPAGLRVLVTTKPVDLRRGAGPEPLAGYRWLGIAGGE